jgi:CBS domain-containing protein
MLQQDTIDFLSHIHPLDLLPPLGIEALCEDAGLEYFRRGVHILDYGGSPSEYLFVVKRGTVSMFLTADDGSELVLDYRGEGEYFGLLSLISGESPRSNVRAEEDTIGLLIPKGRLLAVLDAHPAVSDRLLKSYFLDFIDKTYEETRRRHSGFTNGHRVLFSAPLGEIIRGEPVATDESTSIQESAQLMVRHKISSLVVTNPSGEPVGIMTDRDLRERTVAQGRDLSQPVSTIMSSPIVHVDASEPCSEALFKMMRHNIHHVLVTDAGKYRGMVTNHDFMVLQGNSPTLLIRNVIETHRLEHLEDARARLERTVATLSREGAKAHNISRVITEVTRKLVGRTAALAEAELGPPPVPLTVFLFGEAGRSELSLHRGPELAVAYDDAHHSSAGPAKDYARRLLTRFEGEPVSGRFGEGQNVKSLSEWRAHLRQWVEGEEGSGSSAADLLEMTAVTGEVRSLEKLRLGLVQAAATDEALRARLVAEAVRNRPPLGFLGRLVVGTSGEHRRKLDLYKKGVAPLAHVVRILALERRILARSTLGRLRDLRSRHDYARADEIENAFEYLQTLRIHQQLAHLEAEEEPDDFLDPETLVNSERKSLKEAFQLIVSLYDSLSRHYGVQNEV